MSIKFWKNLPISNSYCKNKNFPKCLKKNPEFRKESCERISKFPISETISKFDSQLRRKKTEFQEMIVEGKIYVVKFFLVDHLYRIF